MYEIRVEGRFSAAHRHPVPGAPPGLHGHDFLVRARLQGEELRDDVLVDFHAAGERLQEVLGELAHRDLSVHPDFASRPATPGALARWIHERLAARLQDLAPGSGFRLESVEVRDTDSSGALYRP